MLTRSVSDVRRVTRKCRAPAPDQNKIANREPFWEPDHTANLVQLRTCTENTSAVLSVKADLSDQSERLVETYGSEGLGLNPKRERRAELPAKWCTRT